MTNTEIRPDVMSNTFSGGMNKDLLPQYMTDNMYTYALNAVYGSHQYRGGFLVNEKSNKLQASFGARIVGASYIDDRDQSLVFTADNTISLFDHRTSNVYKVASGCWDFSKCEFMYAVFKTMQPCNELHAYFSSGCHFYVINIDEMLDAGRAAGKSCEDFRLLRCASGPRLITNTMDRGGHGLENGAYYFVTQLEDRDGNKSNWSFVQGPAFVGSENNIAGEASMAAIQLKVDYLDPKYNKINVAVIKKIDGELREPELVFSRYYNTNAITFEYYSPRQHMQTLSFEEIFNRRKLYLRGQDQYIKDGRLWLYKIRQEKNLNYQRRALDIGIQGVVYEVAAEYAHLYPSLQRGENYLPAIVWNYCDGSHSPAFVMSPGGGGGGGGSGDGGSFSKRRRREGGKEEVIPQQPDRIFDEIETEHRNSKNVTPEKIDTAGQSGSGGGSPRGDDCFYPPELWRRRLPDVPATEEVGGCDDIDTLEIPIDLREEEIDRRQRDPIQQINTTVADVCESVALAEDEDAAQCCLCFDESTICLDNVLDDQGQPCELPAHCCPSGSPCPNGDNAKAACEDDLKDWEEAHYNWGDWLADYGIDKPEPQITSGSLKETSLNMYDKIVKKREVILYSKGRYQISGGSPGGAEGTFSKRSSGPRDVDADGNPTKEGFPVKSGSFGIGVKLSTERYPTTLDCSGTPLYGGLAGTRVQLVSIPTEAEEPLVRTNQKGVVSRWSPGNVEWGHTFVRLLGFRFTNIQFPSAEELPKPLSSTNPYSIVYVKRDETNSTILANGAFFGTFSGEVKGQTHMFPRHAVNSFEHVDYSVDEGGSHIAGAGAGATNKYVFHAPDTTLRKPSLLGSEILYSGSIGGLGFRHGLYAKGKEPRENNVDGTRVDQRGARQSVNLNQFTPGGGSIGLSGIMYAEADSVVSPTAGIDTPLMNKYRESCVYLQTNGQLPGLGGYSIDGHRDRSFTGDVLDHEKPVSGETWKGSIRREIPDQYGNPENQTYIALGIEATKDASSTIEGWCGDVYIGMHTLKRTGFVSEKVGNVFDIPALVTHKEKERTICDAPEDEIFMFAGINFYPHKLPETGDAADAKNWAGLHSPGDAITRPAVTRPVNKEVTVAGVETVTEPETDYYYPKVVKTLVTFWAEGKANTGFRGTGAGVQKERGEVFYPKLKDLEFDSNAPYKNTWEDCWLNRFYTRVEQPSRRMILRKTLIRSTLTLLVPTLFVGSMPFIEDYLGYVAAMFGGTWLIDMWQNLTRTLFNDQYVNRLVGFPICKTDNEGGEEDVQVTGFEDNYYAYNSDFTSVNDHYSYRGMPENYYTCDCSQCDKNITTNEVYYSNKQVLQSPVDAFRNFHSNAMVDIPADSGQLQKLFSEGNGFYAHCTDNIYILQFANNADFTNGQEAWTGRSDLLAEPLHLMMDIPEGFMGTEDPNASINTPYGYIFVNRANDALVKFSTSSGIDILTQRGMYSWFKEHLNYCTSACTDEKQGRFYNLGYDHRNDRLLFSKTDGAYSWTLSYRFGMPNESSPWVSFHSYVPNMFLWNQHHLYSIVGSDIYIHDSEDGDFQTFYGNYSPFIVEYVVNAAEPFQYGSTMLETMAWATQGANKVHKNVTFNKAAFWNSDQGTGTITLEPDFKFDGTVPELDRVRDKAGVARVVRNLRRWNLNEMFDNVKTNDAPLITKSPCEPFYNINDGIMDKSYTKEYTNRILFDKYLFNRLIFDNLQYKDIELYVKNIQTLAKTNV